MHGPKSLLAIRPSRYLLSSGGFTRLATAFLCVVGVLGGAQPQRHTIKHGETLYSVSREFGVPVDVLQSFNQISDPNRLKVGTTLTIPTTHRVKPGETLYGISRSYGISIRLITRINELAEPGRLRIGQTIVIPEAEEEEPTSVSPEVETSARIGDDRAEDTSDPSGPWPVKGDRFPLEGKLSGVTIRASSGDAVVSVSSGTVRWASTNRGYGKVVLVQNDEGYVFGYLGIDETLVIVGDRVDIGTPIGRLGVNSHNGHAELHFLIFKNGKPVDPVHVPRT